MSGTNGYSAAPGNNGYVQASELFGQIDTSVYAPLGVPDDPNAAGVEAGTPTSGEWDGPWSRTQVPGLAYEVSMGAPAGRAVVYSDALVADESLRDEGEAQALEEQAAGEQTQAEGPVRNWNDEFQRLYEWQVSSYSESRSRMKALTELTQAFRETTEATARTIVDELFLPSDAPRTIQPASGVGGVAGGQKYIHNGVFFKFATDTHGLYGSDGIAMKVASLEMTFLLTCMMEAVSNLAYPLMAVIDYRGFRITAMSLLPINPETSLVYGSDDGGQTMHDDAPEIREPLSILASRLNLAPHKAGLHPDSAITMAFPGDLEVHKGSDGRFYVIDTARIMPPLPPKAFPGMPGSFLFNLFRPEFVTRAETPLCSDAYSRWCATDPNAAQYSADCDAAFDVLLTQVVPKALNELRSSLADAGDSVNAFSVDVGMLFGTHGINMSLSGHMLDMLKPHTDPADAIVANALLLDLAVRATKRRIRAIWRAVDSTSFSLSTRAFVEAISSDASPYSTEFWSVVLPADLKAQWPGAWAGSWPELQLGHDLRDTSSVLCIHPPVLIEMLQSAAGFSVSEQGVFAPLAKVRMMSYASVSEASDGYAEAVKFLRLGDVGSATPLIDKATQLFHEAIVSRPRDIQVFMFWAHDLMSLATETVTRVPSMSAGMFVLALARVDRVLSLLVQSQPIDKARVAAGLADRAFIMTGLAATCAVSAEARAKAKQVQDSLGLALNETDVGDDWSNTAALTASAERDIEQASALSPSNAAVAHRTASGYVMAADALISENNHTAALLKLDDAIALLDTFGSSGLHVADLLSLKGAAIAKRAQVGHTTGASAEVTLAQIQRALDTYADALDAQQDSLLVRSNIATLLLFKADVCGTYSAGAAQAIAQALEHAEKANKVESDPGALLRWATVHRNAAATLGDTTTALDVLAQGRVLLLQARDDAPNSADIVVELAANTVVRASIQARTQGQGTSLPPDVVESVRGAAAALAALLDGPPSMFLSPIVLEHVAHVSIKAHGALAMLAPEPPRTSLLAALALVVSQLESSIDSVSMLAGLVKDVVVAGRVGDVGEQTAMIAAVVELLNGETPSLSPGPGSGPDLVAALGRLASRGVPLEPRLGYLSQALAHTVMAVAAVVGSPLIDTSTAQALGDAALAVVDAFLPDMTVETVGVSNAAHLYIAQSRVASDVVRRVQREGTLGSPGARSMLGRIVTVMVDAATAAYETCPTIPSAAACLVTHSRIGAQVYEAWGDNEARARLCGVACSVSEMVLERVAQDEQDAASDLVVSASLAVMDDVLRVHAMGPSTAEAAARLALTISSLERVLEDPAGTSWLSDASVLVALSSACRVMAASGPGILDAAGKARYSAGAQRWSTAAAALGPMTLEKAVELSSAIYASVGTGGGSTAELDAAVERIVTLLPGADGVVLARAQFHLGQVAMSRGKTYEANLHFEAALAAQPGMPEASTGVCQILFERAQATVGTQREQAMSDLGRSRSVLDTALAVDGVAGTPGEALLLQAILNVAAFGVLQGGTTAMEYVNVLIASATRAIQHQASSETVLLEASRKCLGIASQVPQLAAHLFPLANTAASLAVQLGGGNTYSSLEAAAACLYFQAGSLVGSPQENAAWEAAIPLFTRVVETATPGPSINDIERLATAHLHLHHTQEALALFQAGFAQAPQFAYNLACCYALTDQPDAARQVLEQGAAARVLPPASHVSIDTDLASLHSQPWWAAFVASLS